MKPQPTLSLDEFRRQSRVLQENRSKAREEYERHAQEEAQAEFEYRRAFAIAHTQAAAKGTLNAKGIEAEAVAQTAPLRLKRDLAKSLAKSSLLRINELEADRATLRSIAEWSQRVDGVTA